MKMYFTNYSPNGTNDLVIVNGNKVSVIEEALFGASGEFDAFMDEYGDVYDCLLDPSSVGDCGEETYLVKTSYKQVKELVCCSVLDHDGSKKLKEIKTALAAIVKV